MKKPKQMFAIGSYTSNQGHVPDARGSGMSIVGFDGSRMSLIEVYKDLENPAYLAWDPSQRLVYTASESGSEPGSVDVFYLGLDGELEHIDGCSGAGDDACHIGLSHDGNGLFTASYGRGKVSLFRLDSQGSPRLIDTIVYEGRGSNKIRQEGPHIHYVASSPYTNHVYVCDLGTDHIWMHPGRLTEFSREEIPHLAALRLAPGCGPRHLAFDSREPFVFILCELVPQIVVAKIRQWDGTFDLVQVIPSIAEDAELLPYPAPAAIKIHPTGKTLAVSNRFRNTVAVFEIIRNHGLISLVFSGEYPCGGKTPRDIEFSADGSYILIANQDSHTISSLCFNANEGRCSGKFGPELEIGSPACIVRI